MKHQISRRSSTEDDERKIVNKYDEQLLIIYNSYQIVGYLRKYYKGYSYYSFYFIENVHVRT